MLAREIGRLRDLDRRFGDLLAEGMVMAVTENQHGVYLAQVDLEFDGVAQYSVTAESGEHVQEDERVWLVFPRGDLNATPYVLGGLRPRRTRLRLGTQAGSSPGIPLQYGTDGVAAIAWRKLGDVDLTRYHTTYLAVAVATLQYTGAGTNKVHWSARVDLELAATGGGSPVAAGTPVLGRTITRHSVALTHLSQGRVNEGLSLRVERGMDEKREAEIWCGVRHVAVSEEELVISRTEAVTDVPSHGAMPPPTHNLTTELFVQSVELQKRGITPNVTSASVDIELYELG